MLLIGREELLRFCAWRRRYAIDGSGRSGRDVKASLGVECHVPHVLRTSLGPGFRGCRIKDDLGLALVKSGLAKLQTIDFSAGQGRRVNRSILTDADYLHGQILALKQCRRLAVGADLHDARGRAGAGVDVAFFVGSN